MEKLSLHDCLSVKLALEQRAEFASKMIQKSARQNKKRGESAIQYWTNEANNARRLAKEIGKGYRLAILD